MSGGDKAQTRPCRTADIAGQPGLATKPLRSDADTTMRAGCACTTNSGFSLGKGPKRAGTTLPAPSCDSSCPM